jgi:hypothetical protein
MKERRKDVNPNKKKQTHSIYKLVGEKMALQKAKREYKSKMTIKREDPIEVARDIQSLQMKQLMDTKGTIKEDDEDFGLDLKFPGQKALSLSDQLNIIDQVQQKAKPVKPISTDNAGKEILAKSKCFYVYFELVGCKQYEQEEKVGRVLVVNDSNEIVYDVYVNQSEVKNTRNIHPAQYLQNKKIDEIEVIEKLKSFPRLFGFENILRLRNFTAIARDGLNFEKMVSVYLGIELKRSTTALDKAKLISTLTKILKLK